MKQFEFKVLTIIIVIFVSGISNVEAQPSASDFKKLDWLEGTWMRTNSKPGRSGQEYWTKLSDVEWKGLGVTLRAQDTAVVENLKLVIRDKAICYVADIKENKGPTYFKLTEIGDNGFTCENPQHDFPKRITYQVDGKKLKATISGDGKSIDYYFERQ